MDSARATGTPQGVSLKPRGVRARERDIKVLVRHKASNLFDYHALIRNLCLVHYLQPVEPHIAITLSMDEVPPAYKPASYDTSFVGVVRVIVHNLGQVKPGAHISYNHWTVSLLVASTAEDAAAQNFSGSVRLDLRPEGPRNGTLYIEFLNYLLTRNAVKHFDFFPGHSDTQMTVRAVKDLLCTKGRHRYTMAENGGCQWWV